MYDEAPPLEPSAPPLAPQNDAPPQPTKAIRRESPSPEQGASVALEPKGTYIAPPPGRVPGGPPEHASMAASQQVNDVYGPPPMPPPPGRYPVPSPYYTQAIGQEQPSSKSMLGMALVTVAAGAAIGGRLGGWPGAGAGVLMGGGAVNAVRAFRAYRSDDSREGHLSSFYALVGLGAGGFVAYRYGRPTTMRSNPKATSRCDIRPVGP